MNEVMTNLDATPGKNTDPTRKMEQKIPFSILIVDDEDMIRDMSILLLGPKYTSVEAVNDPKLMLEKLLTPGYRPDIIVIDNTMPHMTGLEAIQILRSDPSLRDIPIIMRSSDQGDIKAQAQAMGATFLAKPTKNAVLLAEIERLRLKGK